MPDEVIAPEKLPRMFGSPQAFVKLGESWARYFQAECDLRPNESVLDVGCGYGRVAVPLARFLTEGRYAGFDVDAEGIEWCRTNISTRWPNFTFSFVDVYHPVSNPVGTTEARHFTFPFPNEDFDFAFLISVFTHLLPEDVEHYLTEITRVLKPGGRVASTYVLLNDESERLIESGSTRSLFGLRLKHDHGHYRLADEEVPERLVAYRETFLTHLYEKVGLNVRRPFHYGRWSGRDTDLFMAQDVVVADKA
jgi:SAM-dependent methyltransferase